MYFSLVDVDKEWLSFTKFVQHQFYYHPGNSYQILRFQKKQAFHCDTTKSIFDLDLHVFHCDVLEDLAVVHIPHCLVIPNLRRQQYCTQDYPLPIGWHNINFSIVEQSLQVHLPDESEGYN